MLCFVAFGLTFMHLTNNQALDFIKRYKPTQTLDALNAAQYKTYVSSRIALASDSMDCIVAECSGSGNKEYNLFVVNFRTHAVHFILWSAQEDDRVLAIQNLCSWHAQHFPDQTLQVRLSKSSEWMNWLLATS